MDQAHRQSAIAKTLPTRAGLFGALSSGRLDLALPVAALFVPILIMATVGWLNWTAAWTAAEADMRRTAVSAAEYSERTFEGYRVAVGLVNENLSGLTDVEIRLREREIGLDLQGINDEVAHGRLIYVLDRSGMPLLATNLFPVPQFSLVDRDYFQALSAPDAPKVFVSQTFLGRFDGQLLFSVAQRRTNGGNPPAPDGFDGVVLMSVSPTVLGDGLVRFKAAPGDQIAVVRRDGWGISMTDIAAEDAQPLPRIDVTSPFYEHARQGTQAATYVSDTALPSPGALLAMQAVGNLPLYAISIRPRAQIVAAWRATLVPLLGLGVPATLALVLLSLQVVADRRRLRRRNRSLQRDNALSSERLMRAKRFGLMGTFEVDVRSGVSRRSAEYMSIHGQAPVPAEERHEDWVRRVHPDDRVRAEAEILRALSDDSRETDYSQTYRIVTGDNETRWIAAWGEIDRDETGRAVLLRGLHIDVTPLRTTEMALAESDARLRLAQESMGIGAWEWQAPSLPLRCSSKALELFGHDPATGPLRLRDVLARVHPEDRRTMAAAMRDMRANGSFQAEVRLQRPAAMGGDTIRWIALRARRISARRIGPSRLMGVVYDITDRKRAEELVVLMAHEVEHRAKNALTVVASLLRITRAGSAEELAQVMGGRVRALGQTMALLGRDRWTGADLRDIVENELRPFGAGATGEAQAQDITVSGPQIRIGVGAAQPLSMALHELVTNAAKYGALSVPDGKLTVTWRVEAQEVHIRWQEEGGQVVTDPPLATGFGSRLIAIVFEGQIGGRIDKRWLGGALVCDMVLPASAIADGSGALTPGPADGSAPDQTGPGQAGTTTSA